MSLPYLAQTLRTADYDRYLLSLFAPSDRREALWALYLFNHEIAKTREVVSDTTLGLIRLQWWRDELKRIYEGGSGGQTPILSTLAGAIRRHNLPRQDFEDVLIAREFDLEDVLPASIDGMMTYIRATHSPLTRLAVLIAGDQEEHDEIKRIATTYGVMRTLREVPLRLSQRRCYLPADLLAKAGVDVQTLYDRNEQKTVFKVIDEVKATIDPYRKSKNSTLEMIQRLSFIYLKHMNKNQFNVFLPQVQKLPSFLALRMIIGV